MNRIFMVVVPYKKRKRNMILWMNMQELLICIGVGLVPYLICSIFFTEVTAIISCVLFASATSLFFIEVDKSYSLKDMCKLAINSFNKPKFYYYQK